MNIIKAYAGVFLIVLSLLAGYFIAALRRRRREDVLLGELEQKLDRPGNRVILRPNLKDQRLEALARSSDEKKPTHGDHASSS